MSPSSSPTRHEFDRIERDIDEVKKIAVSARDKARSPHSCNQEEEIKEMKASITQWGKWWRGVMITAFAALLAAGGFLWKIDNRAADVEHEVVKVRESVDTVTETVDIISVNQRKIQATLKTQGSNRDKEGRDQHGLIKRALKEALEESKHKK